MKKRRFKLKPVPTNPGHHVAAPPSPAAPPPAVAAPPPPATVEPLPPPAAPDLAAAFSEAIETLRRNLHCERPAAQNQAAFLLYRIYAQEVTLPALDHSLRAIEANLGLTAPGRSLPARLRQIERATAERAAEERREAERVAEEEAARRRPVEEPARSSASRRPPGTDCTRTLTVEGLARLSAEDIGAATGVSFAESEHWRREYEERLRALAPGKFTIGEALDQIEEEQELKRRQDEVRTVTSVAAPAPESVSVSASASPPALLPLITPAPDVGSTDRSMDQDESQDQPTTESDASWREQPLPAPPGGQMRIRAPDAS